MVLKMKNCDILGVHCKIWLSLFLGGGVTKNQYRGGLHKNGGLDSFQISEEGLAGIRGLLFLRGVNTQSTLSDAGYNNTNTGQKPNDSNQEESITKCWNLKNQFKFQESEEPEKQAIDSLKLFSSTC